MDDSGRIYDNVTPEMVKAKNLIMIPADQEELVRSMNRHERRKWAAEQRKKAKANA